MKIRLIGQLKLAQAQADLDYTKAETSLLNAEIATQKAQTVIIYVDSGFSRESSVKAVMYGDLRLLSTDK